MSVIKDDITTDYQIKISLFIFLLGFKCKFHIFVLFVLFLCYFCVIFVLFLYYFCVIFDK